MLMMREAVHVADIPGVLSMRCRCRYACLVLVMLSVRGRHECLIVISDALCIHNTGVVKFASLKSKQGEESDVSIVGNQAFYS